MSSGGVRRSCSKIAGLPPVTADVARVEEPPAVRLDKERVRVERAVVVEERRDAEPAEVERLAMCAGSQRDTREAADPEGSLLEDPVGRLPHEERHARERLVDEPPVILVRMGDHDPLQGRVGLDEALDRRKLRLLAFHGDERCPDVQHESLAAGALHLDAAAADLVCAAVDANPH